jgi:hypothetical protein
LDDICNVQIEEWLEESDSDDDDFDRKFFIQKEVNHDLPTSSEKEDEYQHNEAFDFSR